MQIQHIDLFVSSHDQPSEGDYLAAIDDVSEHVVPIIGTSGVWDAWAVLWEGLDQANGLAHVSVEPIVDDCAHVRLKVKATLPGKRVGIRVYVLSQ